MKNPKMKNPEPALPAPEIRQACVTYSQEGNTMGTTPEYETIDVRLEFPLGEKDGPFIVLKTKGWSFDDPKELIALMNRTKQVLKTGYNI